MTAVVDPAALGTRFPTEFRFGAATSAYQIEGSASAIGKGPSIWDEFVRVPGAIENGDTGDIACDHVRRFREDVRIMAALGLTDYRFSVSWPRVLPEGTGRVNPGGLDFYDRLVDALAAQGIRPVVTLYHWDLPAALERRGGWDSDNAPAWLAELASVVAARLGDRVRDWITVNEPAVAAFVGHGQGRHAPGRRDWPLALRTAHRMLLSHPLARQAVRAASPGPARVGIALNLHPVEPAGDGDALAATRVDGHENRWFLDPLFGRGYPADMLAWWGESFPARFAAEMEASRPVVDFLGVNYYTRHSVAASHEAPLEARILERGERTATGWEVYPEGLADLLGRVARDYGRIPLLLTETGAAYEDELDPDGLVADTDRVRFLARHFAAAADALDRGAPLEGVFVWSLLDNFEWAEGYRRRFGLVRVDFGTQQRTVKLSARWYRELIRAARGREVAAV